jgi:hypothetical protein
VLINGENKSAMPHMRGSCLPEKEESGRLMAHEVVDSNRERITVPWLWEGDGEPRLVTLLVGR